MKYQIKQQIIEVPEIDLPEGSLPVSVKHHDAYSIIGGPTYPECWQVVWLEPVIEDVKSHG